MKLLPLAQSLHGLLSVLQTLLLSHGLGAEVGVAAAPFQFPGMGLGSKVVITPVFTHSMQDEMGHSKVISHVDSFIGSYTEFPLGAGG